MATDLKISQLTTGDPAQGGDLIPVARSDGMAGYDNFKITAQSIADLGAGGVPYNAFYASENAPAGGNGSVNAPFDTFLAAYAAAAAVGTETDPSVVVLEGNFTFGSWAISPYASVFGYGPAASHLTCTGTISASAAWSTAPAVLRNYVSLSGFTLTANAITLAVDPSLNNQINIQDVEYISAGAEEITIQGFTDGFINIRSGANVNYIGASLTSAGSIYQGFLTKTNEINDFIIQSIGDTFVNTVNCISKESKDDAFFNTTKIFAPNMSAMSPGSLTFSGDNTALTITSDSILPAFGPEGIGTPTLIWQSIAPNINAKHDGINYDSGDGSVKAALVGIDNALGSGFPPYDIIWVSGSGSGGNGSIAHPFETVHEAYAAGVLAAIPFVVAVMPGIYDESGGSLSLVNFGSIYAFDTATTRIDFGIVVLDQTSWTTTPPNIARAGFYGFIMSAVSFYLSVPTASDGNFVMRDIVGKTVAVEKWMFENFVDTCNFADCDFTEVNMHFYGCFVRSPGCYWSTVTASTYNVDSLLSIGNGRFEVSERITQLIAKGNGDNIQNVYLMSPEATSLSSFTVDGDLINVYKTANVNDPTILSGTPVITNVDLSANVYASDTRTNYTPTNATAEGNFQGIDAALASAGGMDEVVVNGGYILVADNTRYIVSSAATGKVYFQTPTTMPVGFYFEIHGAGGNPVGTWNLNTQLSQSLINGADISNVGADRYAILEPSSPTDRAGFLCTLANQDVQVTWLSTAGLTIYEQIQVDRSLYSRTAATPMALYAMGQVDSAYTGYLLQIQRSSDSATAYVMPDLAYRASPLSPLDVGGNVASWSYGNEVAIIKLLDQSGNAYDASGGAFWIVNDGSVISMASTNNGGMAFQGAQSFTGTFAADYTGTELNVFSLSQITQSFDSSVVTLYDPANGDDYISALNCIAFHVPPPLTSMDTYRAATLSTQTLPAINTRLLLATQFDGANNTIYINGAAGTPVASSGVFGFNKVLLSARYVSGSPTNHGYYITACAFVYPSMSGGDFADIQTWIDVNL